MADTEEQDADGGERAQQILALYKDVVATFMPVTDDKIGIVFREKDFKKMQAAMLDFENFYDLPTPLEQMSLGKSGYVGFYLPTMITERASDGSIETRSTLESEILGAQIDEEKLPYFSDVETEEEMLKELNMEAKLFLVSKAATQKIGKGNEGFNLNLN